MAVIYKKAISNYANEFQVELSFVHGDRDFYTTEFIRVATEESLIHFASMLKQLLHQNIERNEIFWSDDFLQYVSYADKWELRDSTIGQIIRDGYGDLHWPLDGESGFYCKLDDYTIKYYDAYGAEWEVTIE